MTPKDIRMAEERFAYRADLLTGAEEARTLMLRMNGYGHPLDNGWAPTTLGEYGGYWLAQEALIRILTEYLAQDRDEARRVVTATIENGESVEYNLIQMALHHAQRGIYFSATITTLNGSDLTDDGEPCEPGHGYIVEHGYVDPSWSWSEVTPNREDAVPVLWQDTAFDPEDPTTDPVLWLVEQINTELGGIEEGSSGRSMYSPGERTYESNTIHVRAAAHPFGFSAEEMSRALAILEGPKTI